MQVTELICRSRFRVMVKIAQYSNRAFRRSPKTDRRLLTRLVCGVAAPPRCEVRCQVRSVRWPRARSRSVKLGLIGTKVIPRCWSPGGTVTDQMEATHEKDQYCTLGWRRRSVREQRHGCRGVYA